MSFKEWVQYIKATYTQSRDAAYSKLQERKKAKEDRK